MKSNQRGLDTSLPPISDLGEIFKDIIDKAIANGLWDTLAAMEGKVITVATMCSGTESPLLAWQMLHDELASPLRRECLDFLHKFSAEIVPYKQAYIARNFSPEIIYRDICEIALGGMASTAYGGAKEIPPPGHVQVLIAGFACVDFSALNQRRKNLDGQVGNSSNPTYSPLLSRVNTSGDYDQCFYLDTARGESGDTLYAIIAYAIKFRPALVLLENIYNAPWDEIRAHWHRAGYVAEFLEVDTKNFYIPHTRIRKYMLCINTVDVPEINVRAASVAKAQSYADHWVKLVRKFQRPASSSVDAFLLKSTDPRLERAVASLSQRGVVQKQLSKEVSWAKCQMRHIQYREAEKLGNQRPCTKWVQNGPSKMLDYGYHDWTRNQVDRVKDTIDITWLLAARNRYDPAYKPRYPDLSQNVDRHGNTAWGITGCITPSGSPYSTTRGGPIVGIEALALQGIPVDKLHLTRETQEDLLDLAGNAMTSTVVGVCLISALIAAYKAIPANKLPKKAEVAPKPLIFVDVTASLSSKEKISFQRKPVDSVTMLFEQAHSSARFCECESQYSRTQWRILVCEECSHTACAKCAGLPEHRYKDFQYSGCTYRVQPQDFRVAIKEALPMRLKLASDLNSLMSTFTDQGDLEDNDWKVFLSWAKASLKNTYYYQSARRSKYWTILYDGLNSRLELQFTEMHAQWYLFAKTPKMAPGDARIRQLLERPIARMRVEKENCSKLLEGIWQLCLPVIRTFAVEIEGRGSTIPSWEARLGLEDFKTEQVWSELNVSIPDSATLGLADVAIAGLYKLCHLCGTANSMLHRRVSPASSDPLYLFLLPKPITEPCRDSLVIATNPHRLQYGEYRHIDATMGSVLEDQSAKNGSSSSLKDPDNSKSMWRPGNANLETIRCSVYGKWVDVDAHLQEVTDHAPLYAFLSDGVPVVNFPEALCKDAAITVLYCEVPAIPAKSLAWPSQWLVLNEVNERRYLATIAWLLQGLKSFREMSSRWRTLRSSAAGSSCTTCAPCRPSLKWRREGKNVARVRPIEDMQDAARYEREMKARPFILRTCVRRDAESEICYLVVHVNVQALLHRARGRFREKLSSAETQIEWRIDTDYKPNRSSVLPSLKIGDNSLDNPMPHIFGEGQPLRVEQQRSLQWLVQRERVDGDPFMLTEWEEDYLATLNLRVEVRARKECQVMGGIVADRVGYGKTIIMLALIERERANAIAATKIPSSGLIKLKATLIVGPHLLLSQWKDEIRIFMGPEEKVKVITIKTCADLIRYDIASFKEADIILLSFSLLANDSFLQRLARFAALPEAPSAVHQRAYVSWLTSAMKRVEDNVSLLRSSKNLSAYAESINEQLVKTLEDPELYETIPSKRLHGDQYIKAKSTKKSITEPPAPKKQSVDKDPFRLKQAKTYHDLHGPLLHMFSFYRLIIDEYTYMSVKQRELANLLVSPRRWLLSGTPKLGNFSEVQSVAKSIGVQLGIDDDVRGVLKTTSHKKDNTTAECFGSLMQNQSFDWEEERNKYAQAFLDKFARQNTAEVGELPRQDYLKSVTLHTAERALYLELQTHLYREEMRIGEESCTETENDYIRRMYDLISTSRSPKEALLRACSALDITMFSEIQGTVNALKLLIEVRTKDLEKHCQLFFQAILEALELKNRCGDADTHFADYKRYVKCNHYGDDEACSRMQSMLSEGGKQVGRFQGTALNSKEKKKVVQELRDKQTMLHKASIELVQRTRMLRLPRNVLFLLYIFVYRAKRYVPKCESCRRQVKLLSGLVILGQCGHLVCTGTLKTSDKAETTSDSPEYCLETSRPRERCPVEGCEGAAFDFHKIPGEDFLGGPCEVDAKIHHGSKIADIVALIQTISKPEARGVSGDQALVFVQFEQLMGKIGTAFTESGIAFRMITGNEKKAGTEDRMLQDFRASSNTMNPVNVLLLNASDSCAAGHNIQNANHVIFVSPFLSQSRHSYDQAYEQAVGRALRYGQKKKVHVHHFLAVKTVDINIIEDRTDQVVAYKQPSGSGELMLVHRNSQASESIGESLRAIDPPVASLRSYEETEDSEVDAAEEEPGEE